MTSQMFNALVVDDDPIARRTVGFALSREDFKCAYAADGYDALNRLATEQFDLIVTDLHMPNKHGHALAAEVLSHTQPPLVIVHSIIDDPRLTKDLLLKGVDDIIHKPTNYASFAAKARALVMRRKQATKEAAKSNTDSPREPAQLPAESTTAKSSSTLSSCPVQPISRAQYERRLGDLQHLFPSPTVAYEVFRLSTFEDTKSQELVATLLQDEALTAEVLRLANSSTYIRSRHTPIDLAQAVAIMGFKRTGDTALAMYASSFVRSCIAPWLNAEFYLSQSLAARIALEQLFKTCVRSLQPDELILCALLHPFGRVVLGSVFQQEYSELIRYKSSVNKSLCELESHVFPESHFAAVGRVLSHWKVSEEVWEVSVHVGETFDSITRLNEPLRSRLELVKIAMKIGELAVGVPLDWDPMEYPPSHVLKRHGLRNLQDFVDQTKKVLSES